MKKYLKLIIIGVILVGLVLGYYFYISNKRETHDLEEPIEQITVVQQLLAKNIAKNYPPTPKEVVKLYADITTAFYTQEYSDDQFNQLAFKIRELYDDELLEANAPDEYLDRLKREVILFKEQGTIVSSYSTSSSTDVFYFSEDGYNFARLNLAFTLKNGKTAGLVNEVFVLRKDADGHWKIYGWAIDKDA